MFTDLMTAKAGSDETPSPATRKDADRFFLHNSSIILSTTRRRNRTEYCRMAARHLKAACPTVGSAKTEDSHLFAPARLQVEKATVTEKLCMVAEDQALSTVHPARKRLKQCRPESRHFQVSRVVPLATGRRSPQGIGLIVNVISAAFLSVGSKRVEVKTVHVVLTGTAIHVRIAPRILGDTLFEMQGLQILFGCRPPPFIEFKDIKRRYYTVDVVPGSGDFLFSEFTPN
jgi:hypothetical protein